MSIIETKDIATGRYEGYEGYKGSAGSHSDYILSEISIIDRERFQQQRRVSSQDRRRSTAFDLPIQGKEPKTLLRIVDSRALIERRFSEKMGIASPEIQKRHSSRFDSLKESVLDQFLKNKATFQHIRIPALRKLEADTIKCLNIYRFQNICKAPDVNTSGIPTNVFNWSVDDFVKRRELPNIIWVDVLRTLNTPKCLEVQKFTADVEEFLKFLNIVFTGFYAKPTHYSVIKDIINYIEDTSDFLKIHERLQMELEEHKRVIAESINKSCKIQKTKRDSRIEMTRRRLEQNLMNLDVFDPIAIRYQIKWYHTNVSQVEKYSSNMQKRYRTEIDRLKDITEREKYCHQCTMDIVYSELQKYRVHYNYMSDKFDKDYESIESKLSYKRLAMEKLHAQHRYLIEQLARFREELEAFREKEAKAVPPSVKDKHKTRAELLGLKKKKKGKGI